MIATAHAPRSSRLAAIPAPRRLIDDAATRLGRVIDATAHGHADAESGGQGYLTARAYFGALIAFVLLQDQLGMTSIRPVDTAEYIHHLARLTIHGTGLPGKQQPTAAAGKSGHSRLGR